MSILTIDEQVALLMQGTEYGDKDLEETMRCELRERLIEAKGEGRALRVYCGFDPTTSDLHLGHTVPMRKQRQFQELGHDVTFVVGDYTSLIGDPSDKNKLRPRMTHEEVQRNAASYAEQAYKILDRKKTAIRFNSEWLSELTFAELIELASNFTVQQFIRERENFHLRWENNDPIYLHETFYGLMQGYDAHMLKADVQIGGTDQMFNIMTAARKVMTSLGDKPNIAIILGILPGTDGEVKMSKSLGNHIPMLSTPEDMFGKIMSVPDKAMGQFMRLVTRWSPDQIAETESALKSGILHPRDAKMAIAHEIVAIFHDEESATRGEDAFKKVFQRREMPDEMPEYTLQPGQSVLDVLTTCGLVTSKSDGRRLIEQKGVRLDGETLEKPDTPFPKPGVLQVGKRRFIRVK
jgi:tyrosyl-tRNA synthetase